MKTTIAFAIVLAALRIYIGFACVPEHFTWVSAFKDVAHLFMGGLLVALWMQRKRWQHITFWSMNALEVAVAVLSRVL